MNNTLYTQLSDLGFGEWLRKEKNRLNSSLLEFTIEILKREDLLKKIIENGDIRGTMINALAFRWLREEKDLECSVTSWTQNGKIEYYISVVKLGSPSMYRPTEHNYDTHSLAEHEALNKAVEILSKGGENGL